MKWTPPRFLYVVLLLAASFAMNGCINIVSQNPLYDPEKDRTFDSKLVGTWVGKADCSLEEVSLQIKTGETSTYVAITHDAEFRRDEEEIEELPFDLVKLGSRRYVFPCALPTTRSEESTDPPSDPEHSYPIAKLKRRGDKLYIRILDANALLELAQANAAHLPHEWQPAPQQPRSPKESQFHKGTLVLQCTREQLKDFMRQHEKALFPDEGKLTFKRVKNRSYPSTQKAQFTAECAESAEK